MVDGVIKKFDSLLKSALFHPYIIFFKHQIIEKQLQYISPLQHIYRRVSFHYTETSKTHEKF